MPSTRSFLLSLVRTVLVLAGVAVATMTVQTLATMPPPPPESDGFAHGMAFLVGSVLIVLSLGAAALGVALPTVLGADDPLGFSPWQRRALTGAAYVAGGGFLLALAYGLVTELQFGFLLWLVFVALAVLIVSATIAWRLAEAVGRTVYRAIA